MITFSNINTAIDLIKLLKINNSKETETAISCIKIEQIEAKKTKFTTYEPSAGYYERYYFEEDKNCFGEVGSIFLVDYQSFLDVITRMSKSVDSHSKLMGLSVPRLTIKHENGMMVLHTNLRYNEQGEEESKGTQVLSLYPGDAEDFASLTPHHQNIIATTNSSEFNNLVKVVSSNGEFTDSSESYSSTVNSNGRLVVLTFTDDKVSIFTTRKCESVWFEISKPNYSPEPKQYYLEGRLVNRLINLDKFNDEINIYSIMVSLNINTNYVNEEDDEDKEDLQLVEWLLFSTKEGSIACRVMEAPDLALESKYKSFKDLYEENTFVSRTVSPWDLKNTFDVMHDIKREVMQQLSLFEVTDEENDTPLRFAVIDYMDKLGIANDTFPIQKYSEEEFPPLCFRYRQVEGISKIISSYYSAHKDDDILSPLIELEVCLLEIEFEEEVIRRAIAYTHFEDDSSLLVHWHPNTLEELEE